MKSFDVFHAPLAGTNLIEASAGTGKTWNLCGLYLRLLLEQDLGVQRILVVTFTNAATAELRERIRGRIAETLSHLRDAAPVGSDPFVPELVETLRAARGLADATLIARLDLALQSFDEAAIFTIHGFCQRALGDAPFTAQMPIALESVSDDAEFVREAANDFWRRRIASDDLDPALAAYLLQRKDSPENFAKLLARQAAKPLAIARWPREAAPAHNEESGASDAPDEANSAGEAATTALTTAHRTARALWHSDRDMIVQRVLDSLSQLNGQTYKPESVQAAARGWDEWLAEGDAPAVLGKLPDKVDLLGTAKLKPKKNCVAPEHEFFAVAQAVLDARGAAEDALARERLALLRDLLAEGGTALRRAKRERRVIAYDDMLYNLYERLTGGDARWLAAALRRRYPAALIDEFQDTDPLQFAIFDTIYGGGRELPLFLVGDPKQAIYSFRNADLQTYLRARHQASSEATLADNQRASAPLIDALNALFGSNARAFMLPGLDYVPVGFGAKRRKAFVDRSAPRSPLQIWALPHDAASGSPLLVKKEAMAGAISATGVEIARLLAAGSRGEITLDGAPLRAGDIAVLVRSHAQGSAMRQALAQLGVGSVELSQESVYRSPDAEDVAHLLAAILEPTREPLLKAALATELIGLGAAAIDALATDEAALLGWVQRFADARDTWIVRGVGVMLRQWLRSELPFGERATTIPARLLARPDGERRLTNLLHLVECLHEAAQAHPAPDALLRWLQTRRQDDRGADDATQLRLESDRNLVQIVTIHKAKGLEYGIVFCPFLWNGRRGGGAGSRIDGIEYHDDEGHTVIDYRKGLDDAFDADDIERRRRLDAAAEDLRLIYVALTRAVHRCVIVTGGYLTQHGKSTSTKESNASLLNWLVAGEGLTPQEWFGGAPDAAAIDAAWAVLAARCPEAITIAPLPSGAGETLDADWPAAESLAALAAPAHLPNAWWIGSYSALVQGATHERAAVDHDLHDALPRLAPAAASTAVAASALLSTSAPASAGATFAKPRTSGASAASPASPASGSSAVSAAPRLAAAPSLAEDDIVHFPRGAAAGDCVHALFECIDFSAPSGWPQAVADTLRAHGPTLPRTSDPRGPALHERMLLGMIGDVLRTPLPILPPVGATQPLRLAEVPLARRLTELEFHLPSRALDADALNDTLAALGLSVPRLAFRTLRGYLKGFIDLVFEHAGRYFVLDWKSNHLGDTPADYAPARVEAAMVEHGYHLQALLYCVALDRLLRSRVPGYDPAQHFGGAIYLFVRGVRPGWADADGTPTGVRFMRPAPEAIARVSALFDGSAA